MPHKKSSKICIKNGDITYIFMWAIVGANGDIMMGFPWKSDDSVEVVIEKEGIVNSQELIAEKFSGNSKVTFHVSGHYKLSAKMGKYRESTDRATVTGPKLNDINYPRRMMELLLPESLPKKFYEPSDIDIVLDITDAESAPSRCTIMCISNEHVDNFVNQGTKFVDTSMWESTSALRTEQHTWTWTLRRSINDNRYSGKIYATLIGDIKWGLRADLTQDQSASFI